MTTVVHPLVMIRQVGAVPVYGAALYAGLHYIAGEAPGGLVTVAGVPARRVVTLLDTEQLTPRRATLSNIDGTYRIDYIADREYVVVCIDRERVYNAAIADRVRPVAI